MRYLASGFRIIGYALLALVALAYEYPWWTAGFLVLCYLVGVHEQKKERERLRATTSVLALSPLNYERYCAELLRQAGWNVRMTPAMDQGVDVVAELRGVRVAVQVKRYAGPCGNRSVQEAAAGRAHYGAHLAAVVTPSASYTRSARELARSNAVLLLAHADLPRLAQIAQVPQSSTR